MADESLFIDKIQSTFKAADVKLLRNAYIFSQEKACNGNPIGCKAANFLFSQNADAVTIAGALLAPLTWGNLTNVDDVRGSFGSDVATVLEDLRDSFLPSKYSRTNQRESMHVLLASMEGPPRKAILYITFRLLALECATNALAPATRKMAQETLDILVPIANHLSLGDLRRRLEDACFQILAPQDYEELQERVCPIQSEDNKCLRILLSGAKRLLANNGIQGRVQGRTKSLHAIHCKMIRTGKNLEEIMDRVGLRIIVASVPECYTILGLLHTHFRPIPGTFDDYIGLPKNNGYQSLHTCVYPVREISHKPIEFQVRTDLMHQEAEHGTAAHWRYKQDKTADLLDQQRTQWMGGLVRQHRESLSNKAFVERLHQQVFQNHLLVFGNGGRIVRLAQNATVRNYMQIINIRFTHDMPVKVNGRLVNIDFRLRDGDSIEVLGDGVATNHVFNAEMAQDL
ncbi:HD domain-containing protein [Desulfobacter hydrogenophilus]|uniref:HD domain-containing protein n=1 Tax=Desulfobacter hydrogenophilus TaxID=2291 RepID=UPI0013D83C1D|nr:HD domain-containing protein [Desulfobacter hydrogenophilus]NDY73067.1 bifunctional (p)ppGpp synthetase/guanosine-3',5'-bis(diphosphate) 3'-pyrophosphohydrolase [Desulfobacter hydrogenophilus]